MSTDCHSKRTVKDHRDICISRSGGATSKALSQAPSTTADVDTEAEVLLRDEHDTLASMQRGAEMVDHTFASGQRQGDQCGSSRPGCGYRCQLDRLGSNMPGGAGERSVDTIQTTEPDQCVGAQSNIADDKNTTKREEEPSCSLQN